MSERDGILNRYKSDTEQHRLTVESLRKSEQNAAGNVQQMAAELENLKIMNDDLQKQVMSGSAHMNDELSQYKSVCDQLQKELEMRLEQLAQETERADENAREASAIRNEVKAKAEELQEQEKSWSMSYMKKTSNLEDQEKQNAELKERIAEIKAMYMNLLVEKVRERERERERQREGNVF